MIPDFVLAALVVFLATSAGAAAAAFLGCMEKGRYAALLAFAAGAMAYSAAEMLLQSHGLADDLTLAGGFLAGFVFLMAMEKLLPHAHRHITKRELEKSKKKSALIAGAIAIHNIPEGFAIATAFAASGPFGWFVTGAMALQDIPEGALASTPLACHGMGKGRAAMFGVFSGLVEGAAAVLGYLFLSSFLPLIPAALAFSAGAMIYVIFVEVLPDAMERGGERIAAAGFAAGALATFALASLLGV